MKNLLPAKIQRLIAIVVLLNWAFLSNAQMQQEPSLQPYAPNWFIDELLQWSPASDSDAVFNRSVVPLGLKHSHPSLKVNDHARSNEANIESLAVFGHTDGTPSQGSLNAHFYAFAYWQYCDLMVYWGGSAKEGIVLAPAPYVTDAAHRHGVPLYGTVFFPPLVYGGDRNWVYEFVQREGESFPVADKLIEVANYYGFDGWFINQESGNTGEVEADLKLAADMRDFMLYFQSKTDLAIQWYDAMLKDGTVKWQHELNEKNQLFFQEGDKMVSNQMFLDFRYTSKNLEKTAQMVKALNRNLYDVYGGIDVQAAGIETPPGYRYPQGANFDVLFPEGQAHAASLAFYVPSWTHSSSADMDEFHKKEQRFWVGANGNPSNTQTAHHWKGVAHYVPASSPVNELPFVTDFCAGQGNRVFNKGEDVTPASWINGWNNLTLQSVQPTWRWVIKGDSARISYDFTDAYEGGNSLKVELDGKCVQVPLYSTDLMLPDNAKAILAFKKPGKSTLKLTLFFADESRAEVVVSASKKAVTQWHLDTLSLGRYKGKQLMKVGLAVESRQAGMKEFNIGLLGLVTNRQAAATITRAPQIMAVGEAGKGNKEMRLAWDQYPDSVFCYKVYLLHNNRKTFLWASGTSACYLPEVPSVAAGEGRLLVEAVLNDFSTVKYPTVLVP